MSEKISIHALREEGDRFRFPAVQPCNNFYPRPPRGGRLLHVAAERLFVENFYPRPPRGGRPSASWSWASSTAFLSTPSARRATRVYHRSGSGTSNFYPRPPRGGRPIKLQQKQSAKRFLSTPSARRATEPSAQDLHRVYISIHALREEGDSDPRADALGRRNFYPRPPRGGRLKRSKRNKREVKDFYPRPPRGGRHNRLEYEVVGHGFLSTPSARRAT